MDGIHKLILAGGIPVCARAVVVATGAQYRKLAVKNYENYENCGLFYAATPMESILCREKDVIVVGGGNSAGQAAMFLSGIARHVYHIVRGPSLACNNVAVPGVTNRELLAHYALHKLRNCRAGGRADSAVSHLGEPHVQANGHKRRLKTSS